MYSAASASSTAVELSRQVKEGSRELIFCSEDTKDVSVKATKACRVSLNRVLVISSGKRKWSIRSFEGEKNCLGGEGRLQWEGITEQRKLDDGFICLLYSSGTTSISKGS